jgi:hypothetical protein
MNVSKARDFFSDYFEGKLEAGLRQSFEQALKSNPQIQAEYEEFALMMNTLAELPNEEIEIPIYLSDRIATRLEAAQEKRTASVPAWLGWFRNLALAGVAGAVLFGAAAGVLSKGGSVATGDLFNFGAKPVKPKNELTFAYTNDKVVVTYNTSDNRALMVDKRRITPENGSVISPLSNSNAFAAEFVIQVEGSEVPERVYIPGSTTREASEGTGNLADFAKALADHYRVPVRVTAPSVELPINWNLSEADAYQCATAALKSQPVSVDQRDGNFICITGR